MAPGHGSKRAARRPEEDKFERKKNDAAALRKLPQHVELAGLKAQTGKLTAALMALDSCCEIPFPQEIRWNPRHL
jgi:hypothetical protein